MKLSEQIAEKEMTTASRIAQIQALHDKIKAFVGDTSDSIYCTDIGFLLAEYQALQNHIANAGKLVDSPEMVEAVASVIHKKMGLYGEGTYAELLPITKAALATIKERLGL